MNKSLSILLPTLLLSSAVWATDVHVSTIDALRAAVADASADVIYLDADMAYPTNADAVKIVS